MGGWAGGRNGGGGRGGWEVRGGLYFPTGMFGVAIYESKNCTSHRPIDKPGGPKRCLTNTGVNIRPIPPI